MDAVAAGFGRLFGRAGSLRPAFLAALLVLLGVIFPVYLAIELTRDIKAPGPRSVDDLLLDFGRQDFDLAGVSIGQRQVPRVFLSTLPRDWRDLARAAERKRAFTMVVLPLVLRANEIVLAARERLLILSARVRAGQALSGSERAWIMDLAARHKVAAPEATGKVLGALIHRIDIVPPSLAIAQAAIESGWGTSRFTTEGNALFGQWAEEADDGMVPAGRDAGRTYAIKRFDTLLDSVLNYMRNLNSHRAYRKFRAARAKMREPGRAVTGLALAKWLESYSQQGKKYVRAVTSIIEKNRLDSLDRATLKP